MQELIAYLKAHNYDFIPVCDGKIHRFGRDGKKDNCWFIGFQNHSMDSGEVYIVAEFGDWRSGEKHTYKPTHVKVSRDEMTIIQAKIAASREAAEKEKEQKQDETAEKQERVWGFLKDHGPTAYTSRKQVTALKGTKRDDDNKLVVPMRDIDGKLWGLQRIAEDGSKRFSSGMRVTGTFFVFGGDLGSGEQCGDLYICEGWATGATIYMATQKQTVCAFNSGNLVEVAREIKAKFPLLRITVCGDVNDHEDIGRAKAEKAAEICQGAVIFPPITKEQGTDFNDMHVLLGLQAVTDLLEEVEVSEEEAGYLPLGFAAGTHFFYRRRTKDIYSTSTFTDVQMFNLAPRAHWAARFESKTGIDWGGAKDHLIEISLQVGPFDASRVRGTGVWLDEGRTVVNSGYQFLVDGKETSPTRFKSHYIYIQTSNRFPITTAPALTVEECKPIVRFAEQICFARSGIDHSLLIGWLAIARIAGALPIRPHLWITGGRGTGKSTLMEQFIYPLLGGPQSKIYVQGGSTEAGIRQVMGASSRPLIMDECEITTPKSKQLIEGIIDLHRQAWSPSRGTVVKGSATGQAVEFTLNYCSLMASIRVGITNDADKSRISVLDLRPPKLTVGEMTELLAPIDDLMGERLFRRSCAMVEVIRESYKVFFRAISARKGNRVAQQYGMLLAGAWSLLSDDVATKEDADGIAADIRFTEMTDEEDPEEDCNDCLEHLLTSKVRLANGSGSVVERTVGEVIKDDKIWQWHELRNYGIVFDGRDYLAISDNHAELKKLYAPTQWVNWSRSLRRIEGAEQINALRFGGIRQRATKIRIK